MRSNWRSAGDAWRGVLPSVMFSVVLTGFAAAPALGGRLMEKAPPAFAHGNSRAVAIDIDTVDIDYRFNVSARSSMAVATVVFSMSETGYPMLDLVPSVNEVIINGETISTDAFPTVDVPDRVTRLRVLEKELEPGSTHVLEVSYSLSSSHVTFDSTSVRVGFFMSDLTSSGRGFMEKYGPANFEFDHVAYRFSVSVSGTEKDHEVFTNGAVTQGGKNSWTIDFPDHFTASSLYFHLSDAGRFVVNRFDYVGQAATIPVTVYASTSSLVNSGVSSARRVMEELENTYGPYGHDSLTIYVTSSGGGMEYGGATMTSLGALGHELTHFWFARGVMPANGNAGWIDEAIASWRDDGYPRARGEPNRSPVNLGNFSDYRRHTPSDAYTLGARLISEFDYMFRDQGGMRSILRELFETYHRQTITVHDFKTFLEGVTEVDLTDVFSRYVFGRNSEDQVASELGKNLRSHHPRPYTEAELQELR